MKTIIRRLRKHFQQQYFDADATPKGVLVTDGTLSPAEWADIKRQWLARYR
jgi:hypothetical protein